MRCITNAGEPIAVFHQEGVVDIAVAQGLNRGDLAMTREPAGNAGELVWGCDSCTPMGSRLKLALVRQNQTSSVPDPLLVD